MKNTERNNPKAYNKTTPVKFISTFFFCIVLAGFTVHAQAFPADLNSDGTVDIADIKLLSAGWLDNCFDPNWCFGADINTDGISDLVDLSYVSRDWLLRSIILPAVFGNNMVLQRDSLVPVWGWSQTDQAITVMGTWNGQEVSTVTDANGCWSVNLQTPPAGGPHQLNISSDDNTIVLNNVMSGDVWICSGQSNMAFTLGYAINGEQEIAQAYHPNIRLLAPAENLAEVPQEDVTGTWVKCRPSTADAFSAVGYYFGRELNQEPNTPVGLIQIAKGGAQIASFMSLQALQSDPDFATRLASDTACDLYNGWIAPLSRFRIKGAIFYQGESDVDRAWLYRKLFPAMIDDWRTAWGLGDFPFYYTQIAPYTYYGGVAKSAELRQAQLMALSIPNTGMVVTHDTVVWLTDIHPPDKKPVGQRLANLALANTYNVSGITYSGPLYSSMDIQGIQIRLHFDHVGSSLVVNGGSDLTDFTIAGSDQIFYAADAVIDAGTVVVSSPSVPDPVAVRFGWSNTPQPNLFNAEGLPASTFRTDDWPAETYTAR